MLARAWFERDAPVVAADLLNKLVVVTVDGVTASGRITETEAYLRDDPASHTFNGETIRNATMFGAAGHLYVYLSYGIHQCANVVTGTAGDGQAVLLRAVDPVAGIKAMVQRRGRSGRDLSNGPGKLCQALGISSAHNGVDLLDACSTVLGGVSIADDGVPPPRRPLVGPRIGITKAVATPWRFRVPSRPASDATSTS